MADIDLPLWSIRPNWKDPLIERLEWKTDIMSSRIATEQRRKVRLSPRRYFEYKVNPTGNARSFFDQWAHKIGDAPFLHPVWIDKAKIVSAVEATDTRLDFSTDYREFAVGTLLVLYKDTFTYEVAEIATLDANGVTLTEGLAADWPVGTTVYPVRRCYMSPAVRLMNLTSTVGGATVEVMFDGPNDYTPWAPGTLLDGYPIIDTEPNRLDDLEQQYNRLLESFDSETGLIYRYDEAVRSFATQFYNWKARGVQANHELRRVIYYLAGRLNPVWMPSFNRDVVLAADLDSADTAMDIEMIGYELTGGLAQGRDRIYMLGDDDTYHAVTIDGVGTAPEPGQERLTLDGTAGFNALQGRSGSFLDLVRMDQDVVEITHYADTAGVSEISAAFRSFNPDREPATVLIDPMPTATMGEEACGEPAEVSPCLVGDSPEWEIWFRVEYDPLTQLPSASPRANRVAQLPRLGSMLHYKNMSPVPDLDFPQWFEVKLTSGVGPSKFDMHDHTEPSEWRFFTQWRFSSFMGSWLAPNQGSARIWYRRPDMDDFALATGWFTVKNHWPITKTFYVP